VLLVAEELDISWFDLSNYEAFKTMSAKEWAWQLQCRYIYYTEELLSKVPFYDESGELHSLEVSESLLSVITELKAGAIPEHPGNSCMHNLRIDALSNGHPFSTASVDSLTTYKLWEMANDSNLDHVWEACQNSYPVSIEFDRNDSLKNILTPYDFYIEQYRAIKNNPFAAARAAHVVINLSATDEQIKNDFSHWLTNYRKAIEYQPQKKLFSQADFDYWVKYGVIPYLDLVLIAKIEGKKITQNKLAKLIFPDEYDVDTTGRLRDTTKPEAERLIKDAVHRTLETQIVQEKSKMKNA
jgi:hypothetical protein